MPCCGYVGAREMRMARPLGACMECARLHRVVQLAGLLPGVSALLPRKPPTPRCNPSSTI